MSKIRLLLVACVCAAISVGCAPAFVVKVPTHVSYAQAGAVVRVLPVRDEREAPQLVSTGYQGLFQLRDDVSANEKTPPAAVLGQALAVELQERGMVLPTPSPLEVACAMPVFLIRYRNYAGAYSATDAWGYLDLYCRVNSGAQVIWEGSLLARHHRVYYLFNQGPPQAIWPDIGGALVQQAAAILNREVFHLPASPAMLLVAQQQLLSGKADERFKGIYTLGVSGDRAVVPQLVALLADPDKKIRRAVVDALGTLGARETLPALLDGFDKEDGNVQWAIIKSILQMGDPQAVAWLKAKAPRLSNDALKEIAADVLAHDIR